jgi:hypothetical protein
VSINQLKDQQQAFFSQSQSQAKSILSIPPTLSFQQQQDSKKEDKLADLDSELIIGGKPIVPHSCCYILKPDNW